jgi:hypothetical protein
MYPLHPYILRDAFFHIKQKLHVWFLSHQMNDDSEHNGDKTLAGQQHIMQCGTLYVPKLVCKVGI